LVSRPSSSSWWRGGGGGGEGRHSVDASGGAGRGGREDVPFFVEYRGPLTGEERNREGEGDVDGNHDDYGRTTKTKGPTSTRGGGGKGWRRRRRGGEDNDADRSSHGVVVVLPPPSSSSSSYPALLLFITCRASNYGSIIHLINLLSLFCCLLNY
jgi:hypothetical protein